MNTLDIVATIVTVFPALSAYGPSIAAALLALVGACGIFVAFAPVPSATSPKWWLTIYNVINFVAANFGNAKNAVPAGMPADVAKAALLAAKITAAAPDQAVVAGVAAVIKPVIKGTP